MEWTTEQVQAEIRRHVYDATEQLRRQLQVRAVRVKRDGRYVALDVDRIVRTPSGVIVEVVDCGD